MVERVTHGAELFTILGKYTHFSSTLNESRDTRANYDYAVQGFSSKVSYSPTFSVTQQCVAILGPERQLVEYYADDQGEQVVKVGEENGMITKNLDTGNLFSCGGIAFEFKTAMPGRQVKVLLHAVASEPNVLALVATGIQKALAWGADIQSLREILLTSKIYGYGRETYYQRPLKALLEELGIDAPISFVRDISVEERSTTGAHIEI